MGLRQVRYVIFVDTNVFMYAVGRPHPLRDPARMFFDEAIGDGGKRLCVSAEVLQELMHAYVAVGRIETLDAALLLVDGTIAEVWPVEAEDVRLAREHIERHPGLAARDLLHLACCVRRGVTQIKTFDRELAAVFV